MHITEKLKKISSHCQSCRSNFEETATALGNKNVYISGNVQKPTAFWKTKRIEGFVSSYHKALFPVGSCGAWKSEETLNDFHIFCFCFFHVSDSAHFL